jgi:hypothetical protein
MSTATAITPSITATTVPGHLRARTLPNRFPGLYLVFEMNIFRYMDKFVKSYNGSYWEYIELSNGGFYMSLSSNKSFNYVSGCRQPGCKPIRLLPISESA